MHEDRDHAIDIAVLDLFFQREHVIRQGHVQVDFLPDIDHLVVSHNPPRKVLAVGVPGGVELL